MNGGITLIAGPGDHTLDHLLTHRTRRHKEPTTREKKTASRIVYRMPQYMYIIDVLAERVTPFSQSSGPPQNPGGMAQTIRLALISGNEYQSDVQAAGGLTHTPLEY